MASRFMPITSIRTRLTRKRRAAQALLNAHRLNESSATSSATNKTVNTHSVRIVCISDTHNNQPVIPPGDILIHAGDLTENGSFDEVQTSLKWLSSLPQQHKILVAGNHDVLLDEEFLSAHPERRYGQTQTKEDLDWGNVIYLQDSSITLHVSPNSGGESARDVTIFGSPWTPQYGSSAFQYRPDDYNHWEKIFSTLKETPDIIVTHGPPHLHLDKRDFHRAGCPYLAQEIRRLRPRLHIFGHIHVGYGKETMTLDTVQASYEEIMTGWASWGAVLKMAMVTACMFLLKIFHLERRSKKTTFINAAIVGVQNKLVNNPIIVDI